MFILDFIVYALLTIIASILATVGAYLAWHSVFGQAHALWLAFLLWLVAIVFYRIAKGFDREEDDGF